jgi:hypothetical protein
MWRFIALSACLFFGSTRLANAEVINVTQSRSVYDSTYDRVVLKISSITGTDVPADYAYLTRMKGTWTLPTGGLFFMSTKSNWYTLTTNDADFQDQAGPEGGSSGSSWLNFSTQIATDPHTRTGGSGNKWNSFTQTFSCTGANGGVFFLGAVDWTPGGDDPSVGDGTGFDNTLLAVLYVTHATPDIGNQTIFSGVGGYAPWGPWAAPTTVRIVLEPSTLALLGSGLFGLFAHAWRRREWSISWL